MAMLKGTKVKGQTKSSGTMKPRMNRTKANLKTVPADEAEEDVAPPSKNPRTGTTRRQTAQDALKGTDHQVAIGVELGRTGELPRRPVRSNRGVGGRSAQMEQWSELIDLPKPTKRASSAIDEDVMSEIENKSGRSKPKRSKKVGENPPKKAQAAATSVQVPARPNVLTSKGFSTKLSAPAAALPQINEDSDDDGSTSASVELRPSGSKLTRRSALSAIEKAPLNEELFGTLTDSEVIDVEDDEVPQEAGEGDEEKWEDDVEEELERNVPKGVGYDPQDDEWARTDDNADMNDEHNIEDNTDMNDEHNLEDNANDNAGTNFDDEDNTEDGEGGDEAVEKDIEVNDEITYDEETQEGANGEPSGGMDIKTLFATMAKQLGVNPTLVASAMASCIPPVPKATTGAAIVLDSPQNGRKQVNPAVSKKKVKPKQRVVDPKLALSGDPDEVFMHPSVVQAPQEVSKSSYPGSNSLANKSRKERSGQTTNGNNLNAATSKHVPSADPAKTLKVSRIGLNATVHCPTSGKTPTAKGVRLTSTPSSISTTSADFTKATVRRKDQVADPGMDQPLNPIDETKKDLRDFERKDRTVIQYARTLLSSDLLTMDAFPDGRRLEQMARECILTSVVEKLSEPTNDDLQRFANNVNIKRLLCGFPSSFRYRVSEAAHKVVNEVWLLDGRDLEPPAIKTEKDPRVAVGAADLLYNNAFLLSEPDASGIVTNFASKAIETLIKTAFYGRNKPGDTFINYPQYDIVPLPAIALAACALRHSIEQYTSGRFDNLATFHGYDSKNGSNKVDPDTKYSGYYAPFYEAVLEGLRTIEHKLPEAWERLKKKRKQWVTEARNNLPNSAPGNAASMQLAETFTFFP